MCAVLILHWIGLCCNAAADLPKCRRPTFQSGWRARWRRVELEAAASDQKEQIAGKISVLRDTTLFKAWLPPVSEQRTHTAIAVRSCLEDVIRTHGCGDQVLGSVTDFVCARELRDKSHVCKHQPGECSSLHWGHHDEQHSVSEFMCRLARKVAVNLDVSAESKTLQRPQEAQACRTAARLWSF